VDNNAQEAYVVYRRLFDFGKITGKSYAFGPVKDLGLTLGIDWNTKNDPGYASRKRMFSIGPTVMMDVPGYWDISLLLLNESNAAAGLACSVCHVRGHSDRATPWRGDGQRELARVGRRRVRRLAAGVAAVIRVDAVWLASEPLDMRAGTDTALARVVAVFGAAQPHHA